MDIFLINQIFRIIRIIVVLMSIISPIVLFISVSNPRISNRLSNRENLEYTIFALSSIFTLILGPEIFHLFINNIEICITLGVLFAFVYIYLIFRYDKKESINREKKMDREIKRRILELQNSDDLNKKQLIDYYEQKYAEIRKENWYEFGSDHWGEKMTYQEYKEKSIIVRIHDTLEEERALKKLNLIDIKYFE